MRQWLIALLAAIASLLPTLTAARSEPVDLLLVLCMDASGSIDAAEFELQRRGYAEALTEPRILDAIRGGPQGAIAVAVVEWGSPQGAATVVPWMRVHDAASAAALAAALLGAPRSAQSYNAIGDAIDHSRRLIEAAPHAARRRVIDLSGDGPDMRSVKPVARARDEAVAVGITINALAIIETGVGGRRGEPLDLHYEHEVIGGPGAFVVVAQGRASFARAIRAKLVREISGIDGPTRVAVRP
ncbi:MAG TPA: DUF1194 domain-containing protein [Vineibacter sp.]|nr:DUF1194 domain-containing protein [Vineibacter sp.]